MNTLASIAAMFATTLSHPTAASTAKALSAFPSGATLVQFDPAGANEVWLATSVTAVQLDIGKQLSTPLSYTLAVPSFEKATVVQTKPRERNIDLQVDWELEIPLWNLKGQLWIKPFAQAVQLRLTDGAFAPGLFLWQWSAPKPGSTGSTIVTLQGQANARDANWGTRQIAKRSPLAEPAMTVAAAFTLLQGMMAVVARAPQRWPTDPMGPKEKISYASALQQACKTLNVAGPLGLVVRKNNGRLDHIEIATAVPVPPKKFLAALIAPHRWQALPGWKQVSQSQLSARGNVQWVVDASFPFLDFDATWEITTKDPLAATAVEGDAQGASWAWHVLPDGAYGSFAVFSLYPRIDRLGYLPRKFIEKEPLLEAGLALALAYVNATSLNTSIVASP